MIRRDGTVEFPHLYVRNVHFSLGKMRISRLEIDTLSGSWTRYSNASSQSENNKNEHRLLLVLISMSDLGDEGWVGVKTAGKGSEFVILHILVSCKFISVYFD